MSTTLKIIVNAGIFDWTEPKLSDKCFYSFCPPTVSHERAVDTAALYKYSKFIQMKIWCGRSGTFLFSACLSCGVDLVIPT